MLRSYLLTVCLFLSGLLAGGSHLYAQTPPVSQPGNTPPRGNYIKAVVVDSLTKEPIEFATFSAKYVGETQPKKYSLTDSKGTVTLSGVGVGRATIAIEYVGYKPKKLIFDVKRGANEMGQIVLQEDINMLDAVVVTEKAAEMVVKKDTIEFNANSFKINETDALEELLKKIPGIEIDSEGKITANGKAVNKIMIDGKTFFLDDPKIASKNLPAKIVNKVRVVERKSDQSRFTGIDDGQEETVIDLGIKPGMMNGLFGNLGGGYGTDNRYQANGFLGNFKQTGSIMLFGGANNTNNRGFSEMSGMGFRGGGRMFGGGSGLTSSWNAGVGGNKQLLDGKLKLQGNYMYMGSDKLVTEVKDKQTMLSGNNTLFNNESSRDNSTSDGHGMFGEVDYAISDNTSILFRPRVNLSSNTFDSENRFSTLNNADTTNRGFSRSFGNGDSQQVNGELLFRQRLGKPGRTMSLSLNYAYSNSESIGYNQSETYYFANDSLAIIDQKYNQRNRSNTYGGRLSYTEPLGKNFFLEGAYRYNYNQNNTNKGTWNKDAEGNYTALDSTYSSNYENIFVTQQAELNFMKQEQKYNFTLGVSMQPSATKSYGRVKDTTYSVINFAPSARLDYRFTDEKMLRVRYRGRTNQPSISQLLPVPDNSNPLQQTIGNDQLQPEFTHSFSTEFNISNRQKASFLMAMLDASYTSDKIVSKKYYTPEGVQINTYDNTGQAIYSTSGRFIYNGRIAKSNFSFSTHTSINFNNGVSYVNEGGNAKNFVENITKNLSISENLRITYRNDFAEVIAGGRVSYRDAWYTVNTMDKVATWSNAITGSANINIPGGFNITSDIAYTFYYGYDSYYGRSSTIWNAEISKKLFKDAAILKVKIYDILKDARSVDRTTTENYVQNVESNVLGQYVMFSLTYQFGKFGGQGMRGGMRGGMGGGRMRMGH